MCHLEPGELSLLCCLRQQQTQRWPPALCHALLQPGALTRHLLPKPGNSASNVKLSLICLSCSTVYSRTNFRKTSSFQPDHPPESSPHPQVLYSFCLEAEEPKLEESPNCVCDKQKKICSTQYTTKKYNRNINLGEKSALQSFSIRIDVLHGSKTRKGEITGHGQSSVIKTHDNVNHLESAAMNSMIIQSKSQKTRDTNLTAGLEEPHPDGRCRQHSPHVRSPFVLLLGAQKLDTAKDLRPDHSKLKILKKFPKIKALIPSCNLKLIFFLF